MWAQNNSLELLKSAVVSSSEDDIWHPSDWGPERDSLWIVIPVTVLYLLIFVTGLIGNACTCVVIIQHKSMRTATNYYLFSLAISDLLLLLTGLPQEIYSVWSRYPYIFGEAFCILWGIASETSANASVLTITAFTIERYIAICHPLLSHTMSRLSRALFWIGVIWLAAFTSALPQAMQFGIVYELRPDNTTVNEHASCTVKTVIWEHSFEASTFVFFVAPLTLISVLYIRIGLQLRQASAFAQRANVVRSSYTRNMSRDWTTAVATSGKGTSSRVNTSTASVTGLRPNHSRTNVSSRKAVVNMLVAVVVAFFVCWAPFHAQRLLAIYGGSAGRSMLLETVYFTLTYISGILYFTSTCVNPVLYHIMSTKFRQAFQASWILVLRSWQCFRCGKSLSDLEDEGVYAGVPQQLAGDNFTEVCSRYQSQRAKRLPISSQKSTPGSTRLDNNINNIS